MCATFAVIVNYSICCVNIFACILVIILANNASKVNPFSVGIWHLITCASAFIKQPLWVFFQYAAIHTIFDTLFIVVSARNMLILLSLIYLNIIKVRIPRARVQRRIDLLLLGGGEVAVFLKLIQRAAERVAGGGIEGQASQQSVRKIFLHQPSPMFASNPLFRVRIVYALQRRKKGRPVGHS
jgi:hypothetical protein